METTKTKQKKYHNLFEKSFALNIITLKWLGLYPFDSYPEIYKYFAWTLYFLFTVPVPILGLAKLIYNNETDLKVIGEMLFLTAELLVLVFKAYPFKTNIKRIKEVLQILNNELFQECAIGHDHFIETAIKVCVWSPRIYLTCTLSCLFTLNTYPFITKTLPVDLLLPYDWSLTDFRYYATFLFIFWGIAHAAFDNNGVDTLVSGILFQAATQVMVLKETLENLGNDAKDYAESISKAGKLDISQKNEIYSDFLYKRICRCIDHHNKILELTAGIEEIFNYVAFTQFLTGIVVICLSLLRFSYLEVHSINFYTTIIYCFTITLGVFIFCYFGMLLYDESRTLTHAIYMGTWYEYDIKSRKALITLMERGKRPILLTAGTVLDLSLDTLSMLARRTYSALAVLWNFTK